MAQQNTITLTTWAILAMFIIGLMFTMTHTAHSVQEAFQGRTSSDSKPNKNRCPNILIQKGSELYLHNSRLANVPGVNPCIRLDRAHWTCRADCPRWLLPALVQMPT